MTESLLVYRKQESFAEGIASYLEEVKQVIDCLDTEQISMAIEKIMKACENERFIYIFGNGGSAATASHFVVDFNKGIGDGLSKRFRVVCLNDNIPTILAIANDVHYHEIFKKQLENFLDKEDLVIAISGSGNSKNVLEAIEYANECGAVTIGLVGFNGGRLKQMAHHSIHVPVNDMQQVEDAHVVIMHLIMRVLLNFSN